MIFAETIFPEKKHLFSNINFYSRILTRPEDVIPHKENKLVYLQYLSIAIDESTDDTNTAHFGIFICGIFPNFI